MNQINPVALFRLSVLGPLVSPEQLQRGELQTIIRQLAQREYAIPDSERRMLGEKTIQAWYYAWRKGGIDALVPKVRMDRGRSKISAAVQEAILAAKRENPRRSINQIERLLVSAGVAPEQSLSRSSVHRLLQQSGLSQLRGSASLPQEKRSFTAEFAGSIWYGDVMHGPRVAIKGQLRKTYLVSLIDDASRLVAHSAFCLGETALDIEGVLKQALLRRGVPIKVIVDNGAAYRAATLQGVCARLSIHLIFCRPYAPEGKEYISYCTSYVKLIGTCFFCQEQGLSFALVLMLDGRCLVGGFKEAFTTPPATVRFQQSRAPPELDGIGANLQSRGDLFLGQQAPRSKAIVLVL